MYQVKFKNGVTLEMSSTKALYDFIVAVIGMPVKDYPEIIKKTPNGEEVFFEGGQQFMDTFGIDEYDVPIFLLESIEHQMEAEFVY